MATDLGVTFIYFKSYTFIGGITITLFRCIAGELLASNCLSGKVRVSSHQKGFSFVTVIFDQE